MPKRGWEIPEREATPEDVYMNRRKFMMAAGGAVGLLTGCGHERIFSPAEKPPSTPTEEPQQPPQPQPPQQPPQPQPPQQPPQPPPPPQPPQPPQPLYPARLNDEFKELDRPLTEESIAGSYNNFYEFSTRKDLVKPLSENFVTDPWTVVIKGEVPQEKTYDFGDLVRTLPLEERLYRLRCVEAWSMAIPWTGFPMKALLDAVQPLSTAKFVKMTTFLDPNQAIGQFNNPQWPWPYVEGLTIEEAANELAFIGTGIYGHEMPNQHGSPIRLVVPWKYGFKSLKSLVSIEFVRDQPRTFWNTLVPREYGFFANVNPKVDHPRWSQAQERFITTNASNPEMRPTLLFNGYDQYVGDLYPNEPR